MLRHPHIDAICLVICLLALVGTFLFLKVGIDRQSDEETKTDEYFSQEDLDTEWNEASATTITLADDGTTVTGGTGATVSGDTVTILSGGTYVIQGTLTEGQIVVADTTDSTTVRLVLRGCSVHCSDGPALLATDAEKVILTLADGTENTLTSGDTFSEENVDGGLTGTVTSKSDLTINGTGSLTVTAEYDDGIVCKDDLIITGGTITVTAAGDGLRGNDSVRICDGSFTVTAGADGIEAKNDSDEDKGYIYLTGGDFTITTNGGYSNGAAHTNSMGGGPQTATDTTETDAGSAKGIKAANWLQITGGTFTLDCADDTLHANGDVTISGGTFTLRSGDDGIHADGANVIDGGTIDILTCYEGIEGYTVDVNDGTINITASDDGINAAGGSDGDTAGQDTFRSASDGRYIRIAGGTLTVQGGGDGLDSDGDLVIEGGTLYVTGSKNGGGDLALDYNSEGDGTAVVTGGTVLGLGGAALENGFGDRSTQVSLVHGFSDTSSLTAGTQVTITDADGNVLASYTALDSFSAIVFSSPDLQEGQTYTITAGTVTDTVTLSGLSTVDTTSSMGGGGQNPGGTTGGRGGGQRADTTTGDTSNQTDDTTGTATTLPSQQTASDSATAASTDATADTAAASTGDTADTVQITQLAADSTDDSTQTSQAFPGTPPGGGMGPGGSGTPPSDTTDSSQTDSSDTGDQTQTSGTDSAQNAADGTDTAQSTTDGTDTSQFQGPQGGGMGGMQDDQSFSTDSTDTSADQTDTDTSEQIGLTASQWNLLAITATSLIAAMLFVCKFKRW